MVTDINKKIEVAAVFSGGVRPVKFRWKNRVYPIDEITYTWRTRDGEASVVHFSVTDGATLYELAYNQSTMEWSLENVE